MRKVNLNPIVYVTLALRQKSPADKVAFGNYIVMNMTNNIAFAQPEPSLISYKATINNLAKAIATAESKAFIDKLNLENAESDFDRETNRLSNYVQNVAWDNPPAIARGIILSAGMMPRKVREKATLPDAVSKLKAIFTNGVGTVLIKWKDVKYGRTYMVYLSTNPDASEWILAGAVPTGKLMVKNLDSGVRYYFKVVTVGVKGYSPASNIVTSIAG